MSLETTTLRCTINGKAREFRLDPRLSLLELLREDGLTGAKLACGVGECGACTVLVDGVPIDSCLYLAVWAEGKAIRTAEGEVRDNQLSAVQLAYIDHGAVQCGFCIPGLVMTSTALAEKYRGQDQPIDRQTVRRELAGNLCRCTGYEKVVDAALAGVQASRPACDGSGGCGGEAGKAAV